MQVDVFFNKKKVASRIVTLKAKRYYIPIIHVDFPNRIQYWMNKHNIYWKWFTDTEYHVVQLDKPAASDESVNVFYETQ